MSGVVGNNIFAALQKKKKSSKPKDAASKEEAVDKHAELEKAIFSAAPSAAATNWADDSEDEWDGARPPGGAEEDGWNQVRWRLMPSLLLEAKVLLYHPAYSIILSRDTGQGGKGGKQPDSPCRAAACSGRARSGKRRRRGACERCNALTGRT